MIGVLLVNLGTPASKKPSSVRRFLKEFLSDPRVVSYPRLPWWLLLNLVILPFRTRRATHAYQKIWTEAGSPLRVLSEELTQQLQVFLDDQWGDHVARVVLAMRYGKPSIKHAFRALKKANVERILILPLYPQYSATTTASVFDAVAAVLKEEECLPELRMINHYSMYTAYITALVKSVHHATLVRPQHLLFSFHGIPQQNIERGDPYEVQCYATARAVAAYLQLPADGWSVAFQSRFGRKKWLKPYCDEVLRHFPEQGIKDVHVICPGFSVDCVETLEEIAMRNKQIFLDAGGENFHYIPALNASTDHVNVLAEIVIQHVRGWVK